MPIEWDATATGPVVRALAASFLGPLPRGEADILSASVGRQDAGGPRGYAPRELSPLNPALRVPRATRLLIEAAGRVREKSAGPPGSAGVSPVPVVRRQGLRKVVSADVSGQPPPGARTSRPPRRLRAWGRPSPQGRRVAVRHALIPAHALGRTRRPRSQDRRGRARRPRSQDFSQILCPWASRWT